jgi:hypothetical protein
MRLSFCQGASAVLVGKRVSALHCAPVRNDDFRVIRWLEVGKLKSETKALRITALEGQNDQSGGERGLLEEGQEQEEEDPENTHGVPVPGDAVDQDLAGLELAGYVQTGECGDERDDAEEEMDGVYAGDQVEEVTALVGAEEDVLGGELTPADPLTGEEEQA